ncbi:O-antigen ligase family protein [Campylobacter hyointestinalis]|uniref:O-antigen ligase family protein n=1 Tax=Campylobacter hyointestinalis TaxID=198 RepID=UPI00072671A1|nr:O-antigen ligase family protein [Campylobacter hyointestinalis]CUU79609.1 Lipid A core-O-antigen ligase and related enzymes [Campylobacter hyointestinalis subsp. hyointestinalis]
MLSKLRYENIMQYMIYLLTISFFIGKSHNVVGALVVLLFLFDTIRHRNFYIFKDKLFIFLSLWCGYLALSVLWATHKSGVISAALVLFLWVLLYLAIKTSLNSKEKLERFFQFQAYLILFITINALVQLFIGYNLFGTEIINGRATDLFSSDDRIFPFIIPLYVAVFGAMLTLQNRPKKHYILYGLALFSILIALPISGTRGPIVVLAIFLPIIAWVSPYRKAAFAGLGALCLCIATLIATNTSMQNRLSTLLHPFENQKHTRIPVYLTAIEMFKDNPIIGVGFKNFRYREFDYYKPEFQSHEIIPEENKINLHAHSPWLDIASEQGMIGICFLLTLFGSIFLNAYKKGPFVFISTFGVIYAFSFLNSTLVLSSSRWSFFMIMAIAFYSILTNYYKLLKAK